MLIVGAKIAGRLLVLDKILFILLLSQCVFVGLCNVALIDLERCLKFVTLVDKVPNFVLLKVYDSVALLELLRKLLLLAFSEQKCPLEL